MIDVQFLDEKRISVSDYMKLLPPFVKVHQGLAKMIAKILENVSTTLTVGILSSLR